MYKVLAISGSLRENSSSNLILKAIISMAPTELEIEIFPSVGDLPHFNDPKEIPESVINFRNKIRLANALLICTPEYAFGVPGALKNALDWTVGSGEFVGKPVSLITASSQGEKGHAALLLILTALSAKVIDEASLLISFVRSKLDDVGQINDPILSEKLQRAIDAIQKNIS